MSAIAALFCLAGPGFRAEVKIEPNLVPPERIDPRKLIAENPKAGKLIEVPFIAQEQYQCGPASLAMVLRYYGIEADPEVIYKKFESKTVAGVFTVDLLIAATDAGMDAHWVKGELASLKKEIDEGRPAIVFLNLAPNPIPARHFAVALGYLKYQGKDYLALHSGPEAYLMVPEKKFTRQWRRTGNLMMTIKPKPTAPDQNHEPL